MSHRFPFPSGRTFLLPVTLALLLGSFSHCQKKDETPPPPKVQAPSAESPMPGPSSVSVTDGQVGPAMPHCCQVTPNTGLKEGIGRMVVNYPSNATALEARMDIYKVGDSKAIAGGYGNQGIELSPGTYDIVMNGKRLTGVTVQTGRDTQINVGVLHVYAGKETRFDLLDPASEKVLTGGYGEKSYGLPIGQVSVQVAGQVETVTIEEGKVTEF